MDPSSSGLFHRLRDRLFRRRGLYQATFENEAGSYVLGDLYQICHAGRSTWNKREGVEDALVNEGKRQVWLHIRSMLNADDNQLDELARQHVREQNRVYSE